MDGTTRKDKANSPTSVLLRRLFSTSNIEKFIKNNSKEWTTPQFHEYISTLCVELDLVPEQVILQSAIERTYGHQLFNGTRKPSRDKAIQLAFGFGMNVEDTQKLLQVGQKNPLYPRIKRDAAILYCINHHKDIYETQSVLEILGLTLLGGG